MKVEVGTFEARGITVNIDMNGFQGIRGSLRFDPQVMDASGPDGTSEQQVINTFGTSYPNKKYSVVDHGAFTFNCLYDPGNMIFRFLWDCWKQRRPVDIEIIKPEAVVVPQADGSTDTERAAVRGVAITASSSTENGVATFSGSDNIELLDDALAAPGCVLKTTAQNLNLLQLGDAAGMNRGTMALVSAFAGTEQAAAVDVTAQATPVPYSLATPEWKQDIRGVPTNFPPNLPTVGRSEISFNIDLSKPVVDTFAVS